MSRAPVMRRAGGRLAGGRRRRPIEPVPGFPAVRTRSHSLAPEQGSLENSIHSDWPRSHPFAGRTPDLMLTRRASR
jgi:hypothetical protein